MNANATTKKLDKLIVQYLLRNKVSMNMEQFLLGGELQQAKWLDVFDQIIIFILKSSLGFLSQQRQTKPPDRKSVV